MHHVLKRNNPTHTHARGKQNIHKLQLEVFIFERGLRDRTSTHTKNETKNQKHTHTFRFGGNFDFGYFLLYIFFLLVFIATQMNIIHTYV